MASTCLKFTFTVAFVTTLVSCNRAFEADYFVRSGPTGRASTIVEADGITVASFNHPGTETETETGAGAGAGTGTGTGTGTGADPADSTDYAYYYSDQDINSIQSLSKKKLQQVTFQDPEPVPAPAPAPTGQPADPESVPDPEPEKETVPELEPEVQSKETTTDEGVVSTAEQVSVASSNETVNVSVPSGDYGPVDQPGEQSPWIADYYPTYDAPDYVPDDIDPAGAGNATVPEASLTPMPSPSSPKTNTDDAVVTTETGAGPRPEAETVAGNGTDAEPETDAESDEDAGVTTDADADADADTNTNVEQVSELPPVPVETERPTEDYSELKETKSVLAEKALTASPDSSAVNDAQCRYLTDAKSKKMAANGAPKGGKKGKPLNAPCFETPSAYVNMTVELGADVQLICNVRYIGRHAVTWWKEGESFPTAIGHNVFIRNDRIAVHPGKRDWNMVIRFVQLEDSGIYRCQINTQPIRHLRINLTVVEELPAPISSPDRNAQISDSSTDVKPESGAIGSGSRRKEIVSKSGIPAKVEIRGVPVVEAGQETVLTCFASGKKGVAPETVNWFFRGKKVRASSKRVSVYDSVKNNQLVSSLRVTPVTIDDAGNYVCMSSEKNTATFDLAVICSAKANCVSQLTEEADRVPLVAVAAVSNRAAVQLHASVCIMFICLLIFFV